MSIIQHVPQTCGLSLRRMESITIYEENNALFNWKDDVEIQKIRSCENLANLFIKFLPRRTFEQLVYKIGLHHIINILIMIKYIHFKYIILSPLKLIINDQDLSDKLNTNQLNTSTRITKSSL